MRKLIKTTTYGIMHVCVATALAYLLSGSWTVALSIGLLEPFVQTFFFFWHETMWEGRKESNKVSVLSKAADNLRNAV